MSKRYDTIRVFNVDLNAVRGQLNLAHDQKQKYIQKKKLKHTINASAH